MKSYFLRSGLFVEVRTICVFSGVALSVFRFIFYRDLLCSISDWRMFSTLPEKAEEVTQVEEAKPVRATGRRIPKILEYRHAYPEFLPDPNPKWRNTLREKLERQDMLNRRKQIDIPEFYVGMYTKNCSL